MVTESQDFDGTLVQRLSQVTAVAGACANSVDQDSRFPTEAISNMRDAGLLRPGPGRSGRLWSEREIFAISCSLGEACASTAMIWSMHQSQLLTIVRQASTSPQIDEFIQSAWATQPLVASLMSEGARSAPRDSSAACVVTDDGWTSIQKDVSVSSYLYESDAALVVARRSEQAPAADQVLVLAYRGEMTLEHRQDWSALGLRGTRGAGCRASISVPEGRILAERFSQAFARNATPLAHLGWAGCWLGIARSAVAKARSYLQAHTSANAEYALLKAVRLGGLEEGLQRIESAGVSFARHAESVRLRGQAADALQTNNLRLIAAEDAQSVVLGALQVTGLSGYREEEGSEWSLSRHVRDILSASIMMSGDRLLLSNASLARFHTPSPLEALSAEGRREECD